MTDSNTGHVVSEATTGVPTSAETLTPQEIIDDVELLQRGVDARSSRNSKVVIGFAVVLFIVLATVFL